ncbi:MAG: ATP-binding protein, partial [Candidatus Berkiella sp.]
LSNQVGQITNMSEIASKCGFSNQTATRYFSLMNQLYLVDKLLAWHSNENKRLVKAPKIHFVDTGLLCSLRAITREKLENKPELYGHLLENYIYCELRKQASWLDETLSFYHYRDKDKIEVDFVLETADGGVIGIEVKAAATLVKKDFSGLTRLAQGAGSNFKIGILLYDGDHTTSFGENLYAVPIGAIWS